MALTTIQKDKLQDIADAIRQKKSSLNTMTPGEMPAEILSIPTTTPSQTKSVSYSSNDTYTVYPDPGYFLSSVETTVAVPAPVVDTVSASYMANGNYEITPSSGHLMDRALVTVNVPGSSPSQTKSASYAANGTYVLTPDSGYLMDQANITVSVPEPLTQRKEEIIRDVDTWHTITPDSGYLLNQVKVLAQPQTQVGYFNVVRNGVFNVEPDEGKLFTNVLVEATVPQINTQTKSATYTTSGNYTITPDTGYALSQANVKVAVPAPVTQAKTETYTINGTYTISPDSGYDYLTGATVTVSVPTTGTSNFAKHRFQTSSGGSATWQMAAMSVGESIIQDLVFYYPTMQVSVTYKAKLPAGGTYELYTWGSSNIQTLSGGTEFESHSWSYNSSKSGDIGAATTWVVTRLT